MNTFRENGSLLVGSSWHEIVKNGFMSGCWSLMDGGTRIASARKPNPFTRTFSIETDEGISMLEAASALGRTMRLSGPGISCEISPDHPLTRRAHINGCWDDLTTVAFAFWLTSLLWRRTASNAAAGGS